MTRKGFTPWRLLAALGVWLLSACGVFYTLPSPGEAGSAAGSGPVEMAAWLVYWDPASFQSFQANVGRLARVYPEAYSCGEDGLPRRLDLLKPDDLPKTVALARAHGVKVLGTMNNYSNALGDFDKRRVQRFLHDPALRERHIAALIALAREDGLDGLDVDYEALDAGDRGAFTTFVTRLAEQAHAQGLLVGLAAHPKESEPGTWGGPQAQDYEALGRVVDYFHVMTYDLHWASGSPGPVAPLAWVRSVMQFAAARVPRAKLELGLNAYGYVWRRRGETLTWQGFLALQAKFGRAERDFGSNELKLQLPDGEAWMSDAQTSAPKLALARELGLRGCALWVLGQEDPKLWSLVDAFNGKR
jgi:spore germination protein YaaH